MAVDVALLTVRDGRLSLVAVEHRRGGLALPGTFLWEGELLAESGARALRDKAGVRRAEIDQLRAFDAIERDERYRVISIGHYGVIREGELPGDVQLVLIAGAGPGTPMLFDHADIARVAVRRMREDYAQRLDPGGLLTAPFTVNELRALYESVFARRLMKDSFRRHVIDGLRAVPGRSGGRGKPAQLYEVAGDGTLPPAAWGLLFG